MNAARAHVARRVIERLSSLDVSNLRVEGHGSPMHIEALALLDEAILLDSPASGASMNPARTLGPDLVRGDLSHLGVFRGAPSSDPCSLSAPHTSFAAPAVDLLEAKPRKEAWADARAAPQPRKPRRIPYPLGCQAEPPNHT